jgi:serine/threonine-protein kinase
MIHVAGGSFKRRKPGHAAAVTVSAFCIDRAEVTVAAYKQCVREKKCSPRCLEIGRCTAVPTDADWPDRMEAARASMFCNGSRSDRDEHPVNCVSFDEAKGYCASRDRRLPTGDEWEWTAVGDKPAPVFPWGAAAPDGAQLCWGRPFKRPSTCLPGSFAPDTTRDGVVDMAGNLSEWVVEGKPDKPRPRLRGASWYAIDDGYVEAALWGFESTSSRSEVFGFRCAKDAPVKDAHASR